MGSALRHPSFFYENPSIQCAQVVMFCHDFLCASVTCVAGNSTLQQGTSQDVRLTTPRLKRDFLDGEGARVRERGCSLGLSWPNSPLDR